VRSPFAWLLSLPVHFYRRVISPLKPKTCRFEPTCSGYALDALRVHGAVKGSWLTLRRLCRCHPFCEPGFDPVPQKGMGPQAGHLAAERDAETAQQREPTRLPSAETDRAPPS
jgi:putative membrane protein insertion efficiency factor